MPLLLKKGGLPLQYWLMTALQSQPALSTCSVLAAGVAFFYAGSNINSQVTVPVTLIENSFTGIPALGD